VSKRPRPSGVARRQNDFVVANRHTFPGVDEADSGQQRPSWNAVSLPPRLPVVVTQQDVPPLSHRHQALARRGNIEKKRASRKRRMFGQSNGAFRLCWVSSGGKPPGCRGRHRRGGQRGSQRERPYRQMPQQLYRTPLICSALG
jgi:hypothetical protein